MHQHSSFIEAKRDFKKPFFMEVVMMTCWHIWKQRNGMSFQFDRPSFADWNRSFIHDMSLLGHRIKKKHHSEFMAWIGSLL
jgi:hypothetical protein